MAGKLSWADKREVVKCRLKENFVAGRAEETAGHISTIVSSQSIAKTSQTDGQKNEFCDQLHSM